MVTIRPVSILKIIPNLIKTPEFPLGDIRNQLLKTNKAF